MADNACGLAVRTAYMLGLHLEPPQTMPLRERELRKRLWWTLESHLADLEPPQHQASAGGRTGYTAFYNRVPDAFNVCNSQPITELLEEWLKGVPEALKTKRQNNGVPFSTDRSALKVELFTPLWLQRQRLLLELMYHNLCTNLYRPSISFALALARAPHPLTDRTAMKCAAHAMALTHMMHQVMLSTSILAGWHEAFQWQWNAAMTLVGFVLAYPQGASTWAARSAIDLSVAVFENFGNSFAVAASAATIMTDLSAKVDLLIEQSQWKQVAQTLNASEKMPMVRGSEESGYEMLLNGDFTAAQIVDGTLSSGDETTAEITRVLAQSIDIFAETYNDFDCMNSNFPDQWAFMQQ
ncbi:hypothetical protein V1520DRAFT_285027 [Lipomyces starkeyi]|uniref:Transcription factor domain-containing protein n=1 Tax=Lipomyces starkeyi NRRL Y-11557 TaxID=675824 RepID=A0A1E3PU21_LIPST|nr:hypothetical protein LIPSTDRAFT_66838 [Lipomyces starkeyi NRRL Y-11557]